MITMSNADVQQAVTDRVMEQLRKGVVPWARPWTAAAGGRPMRVAVNEPYEGVNILLLGMEALDKGYASPWWGTYDQWAAKCGMQQRTNARGHKYWVSPDGESRGVIKGETSTKIVFSKTVYVKEPDPVTGEITRKAVPLLRFYSVFNAEQCYRVPGKYLPKSGEFQPVAEIQEPQVVLDRYLAQGGPGLRHVRGGNSAHYRPATDTITLPDRDQFASPEAYYSTAFHEAGHSTGHKDRLNRPGIAEFDHFGSGQYAKEELVAQMTSAMLQAMTGIETGAEFTRTVGYVDNWLGALANDRTLVPGAASAATKATDVIMDPQRLAELQAGRGDREAEAQEQPQHEAA
jgi:antirestriction protein ArdC